MADKKQNPVTGGNKPKPTGNGGESAKDKSRAASRPVAAKGGGGGKGGNTPRPGKGGTPSAGPKGSRTGAYIAWGAVALVIVVIAGLFIFNATKSKTQDATFTAVTPAPVQVVKDVTTIPMSTWDKVGVTSQAPVAKPTVLSGQPPMTVNHKSPAMLYYGAEYCPYCAAERWAMTAALARFGTWSNLQITASSHTDVDPATHTFSFHGVTFDSPYITFKGIEQYTNQPVGGSTGQYTHLQDPTKEEAAILAKYSSSKFNPNASTSGGISFPFVNINNAALISGASYDPQILAGQSWTDISGGLSDPTNPTTQAILATGNYMSAAICQATHGQPGKVCTSSGVQAAAKALGISAS
ncbi:MAG TPA: DUF929 family protein [Acidimicrobiales bacterium]